MKSEDKWVLNVNTIEPENVPFESILIWIFKLMDAYGCKPSNPEDSTDIV